MENKQLNLDQSVQVVYREAPFSEHQVSIMPRRTPEEITAELEAKKLEAEHQRYKERILLNVTLMLLTLMVFSCLLVMMTKGLGSDEGKLAFGALATILGTLLGYFTGKSSK